MAMKMIDRMQKQLLKSYTFDYANGLPGIGAGIEYLSQNGFLHIDTDDILEDLDHYIRYEIMYNQPQNYSLFSGFCGLGQYLLYRLNNRSKETGIFRTLANQELMVFFVNILENNEIQQQNDIPAVLSLLFKLYRLDICNPKIDRYMDKLLIHFSSDSMFNYHSPAWTLALLRMASLREQFKKLANQMINMAIKDMELAVNNKSIYTTDHLHLLLTYKRLILQTGTGMNLISHLDEITNRIINQYCANLFFSEKDNLSLKGFAGVGLAIMTVSGGCDSRWLDLIE